jgi:hypothetical protein
MFHMTLTVNSICFLNCIVQLIDRHNGHVVCLFQIWNEVFFKILDEPSLERIKSFHVVSL